MKIKILLTVTIIASIVSSCSTNAYYQLYKASPITKLETKNNGLVYEDDNCRVTYNLWTRYGDAGFTFFNKTNENIYLNLADSYFILNGIAYDYFKNREFITSTSESLSVDKKITVGSPFYVNNIYGPIVGLQSTQKGTAHTSGNSVSITESKIICVPPKTAKIIAEYTINQFRIKNCDLLKYPSKKQVQPITFSNENSPLSFSNKISYNVGTGNTIKFENSFYISEISNHPKTEFTSVKHDKECGDKVTIEIYNYAAPDKFYINYSKGTDASKY